MNATPTTPIRGLARSLRVGLHKALGVGKAVPGSVRWGDLRRCTPIGGGWGFERGQPVDRFYIEAFLQRHRQDIAGHVLEVQTDNYSQRFGGERVTQCDVLDIDAANPRATIVADLNDAGNLPVATFDCIVITQTLQFVFEFKSALCSLERALAPGGVLLLTVPGISRVPTHQRWYWSFTPDSMNRLLGDVFAGAEIAVSCSGNVKTATAFLHGLAQQELRPDDFDHADPVFPVIVAARVRKP